MIIPICSLSALHFWLYNYSKTHTNKYSLERRNLVALPPGNTQNISNDYFRDLAWEYGLPLPVNLLIPSKKDSRKRPDATFQILPAGIPESSFIQLDEHVYISSPELCFLQIANLFPLPKLVEIANILCSTYIFNHESLYFQSSRAPIMNTESLRKFLLNTGNVNGIKKAKLALQFALDNSNSPKESQIAALAVISLLYGGYAVEKPELNGKVFFSKQGAHLLGRDFCRCDMLWRKKKVALEYDSNLAHVNPEQHAYDKKRITALNLSGYTVISITSDQIKNFHSIDETFFMLRKSLGMHTRNSQMAKYAATRRKTVDCIMFGSIIPQNSQDFFSPF